MDNLKLEKAIEIREKVDKLAPQLGRWNRITKITDTGMRCDTGEIDGTLIHGKVFDFLKQLMILELQKQINDLEKEFSEI